MGNQQLRMRGNNMNLLEKRLKEKYPDEEFEVLSYTKMREPAQVKCLKCGTIYNSIAESYLKKNKTCFCYACGKVNNLKKAYQEKINKKFPDEEIQILEFNGAKGKLKVKCLKCGSIYEYQYGENILLAHKKRVCEHCFPNKRKALQNTINNFKEFTKISQLFEDFEIPNDCNSDTLIKSKCKICGKINYKTMYDYMRGRGCTCQGNNQLLTQEEYQKRLGVGYTLISEYKGLDNSVLVKHNDCGFIFKTNARHVSCPHCKGSKGEQQIRYWLKKNNFNFIEQYSVIINSHNLRFDFYLPDYDLYIEFQGIQHFTPIDFFGGEKTFQKQVEYDNWKRNYAKDKLLEIKYDEDISLKLNEYMAQKPRA